MNEKVRQLGFNESRQVLTAYDIPILGRSVTTLEEVKTAAAEFGFPVVLKGIASGLIHKTDVGIVFLNLKSDGEVAQAFNDIHENVRRAGADKVDGVLVQKMAEPGFELLIGAKQDPGFGPVTMMGHGGRFVELFADVAPGVGILERDDVERMLSHTMAGRILEGFRGPPLDKEAVIDLAVKVSRFMDDRPEINELDLNPVIVYEKGFAIVDARLIQGDPVHLQPVHRSVLQTHEEPGRPVQPPIRRRGGSITPRHHRRHHPQELEPHRKTLSHQSQL